MYTGIFQGKRRINYIKGDEDSIRLRLCLVAVKRFSKNIYFSKMLIFEKEKCFHDVWLYCKKFFGKYFLMFEKEKRKLKLENAE